MAHLNQIALSVRNLRGCWLWYQEVFGLQPAGGTRAFRGYIAEKVQGLAGARSTCWWLLDRKPFFQLELFEFERPEARPQLAGHRLCDIGYGMIGLHVTDFDAVLSALTKRGAGLLSAPLGESGSRRVCVRDPEGVLLEIMEDDPLGDVCMVDQASDRPLVAVRSITLSVADMAQSENFFIDVLGMEPVEDGALHNASHAALWGLASAHRRERVLRAGGVLVELVQYLDPIGRPRPDGYRISDQGILNIALGFRSQREFERAWRRCRSAGLRGNWWPLRLGAWSVVYVNDNQGFSVELLHVARWYDRFLGFRPKQPPGLKGQQL